MNESITAKFKNCLVLSLALFACLSGSHALAQSPLAAQLEIFQVQQFGSAGQVREQLVEVAAAHPGTHLEYVLTYRNISNQALAGFDVISPIPLNTYYLAGTAEVNIEHQFQVSLDGGSTWLDEPVRQFGPDGQSSVVTPSQQYTDLRWVFPGVLQPAEEVRIRYRVQVR